VFFFLFFWGGANFRQFGDQKTKLEIFLSVFFFDQKMLKFWKNRQTFETTKLNFFFFLKIIISTVVTEKEKKKKE